MDLVGCFVISMTSRQEGCSWRRKNSSEGRRGTVSNRAQITTGKCGHTTPCCRDASQCHHRMARLHWHKHTWAPLASTTGTKQSSPRYKSRSRQTRRRKATTARPRCAEDVLQKQQRSLLKPP
ncbi:hypothetical protein TRVL_08935 [Trypanosoma vivax]|nr:hypothetical protein TRVL_08935 [Trypanosoma vivax]